MMVWDPYVSHGEPPVTRKSRNYAACECGVGLVDVLLCRVTSDCVREVEGSSELISACSVRECLSGVRDAESSGWPC